MNSKYYDVQSCMQVIGDVLMNPNLLDLEDKYHFHEEDFAQEFHRILFGSIYNLHKLGAKEISVEDIEQYLEQRPKKYSVYKLNKGSEYLESLKEMCQLAAFDYYYNRMKKMTLLRMYNKNVGIDLSWLYDPDNVLDVKKKEAQEAWFDNTSIMDIANVINDKIDDIKSKYVDNAEEGLIQAGNGAMALLERLKEKPEIGYPLFGKLVNGIHRGARLKKFYLRSAATGVGKAAPNSTIIPTPNGLKTIGEIQVGDYLFDAFGNPTLVKAVYPQGKKEVWEITFKDGRKAKCCEEHLWSYCTEGQRKEQKLNRKFYTKTLKEINKMQLYREGHGYKILVPMQKAVKYPFKQYYVDPYIFGLLLGDGSFRYNKNKKSLMFSSADDELPKYIAKTMNWNVKQYNNHSEYSWYFEWKDNKINHINVWVEEALKDFPALWQTKSETKFIPREYLEGSIEQRFDLLNGLLDTDGSIDKEKGRISYYTVSPRLRDDIIELSLSLGFKATWLEDNHKDSLPLYKIEITGTPEDKLKLFKLKRKHNLIEAWYNNGKRKELNLFNPIIKIEKLNYSEEMTCFYVDNEEHLFLMNDYIVTHNTRSMIADACSIACNQIYNIEKGEWEPNGTREPTQFITTEQTKEEIQPMMIAFISGVDEEHIMKSDYAEGEWERVVKAAEIIERSPLYIKILPDFSLQDIENTIKFGIRQEGVRYIFMDYIHSSMKILSEISSKAGVKGLREDNILFMISVRLKDLCNQYGVFIMSATQLNADYISAQQYDQNLLRGAKAIADKIDCGMIMLQANQDDFDSLKTIVSSMGIEMPTIKISIYKNRGGRYKDILLWCKANRGICRIEPIFATTYNYELINIEDLKITVTPRIEASAF